MDYATILGTLGGLLLIFLAIFTGDEGGVQQFVNLPSFLIVIGGTIAATTIAFPSRELQSIFEVTRRVFDNPKTEVTQVIRFITDCQERVRAKGHLALESMVHRSKWHTMRRGLQLIADGTDDETLKEVMTIEQKAVEEHHRVGQRIFGEMAKYAPAFGMLGTLVGLVKMLAHLDDPGSIGPKMAIALLTTFYGLLLANLIFLPMVTKLERRTKIEVLQLRLMIIGLLSINKGESLVITREKMGAFLATEAKGTPLDRRRSGGNRRGGQERRRRP